MDAARFTRTTRPLPHFVVVALLIIAYVLAGKLGLSLAIVHPSASAVWAPTGIALAALLGLGYRVWPGIFIGAFLVNVTTAGSILTSLGGRDRQHARGPGRRLPRRSIRQRVEGVRSRAGHVPLRDSDRHARHGRERDDRRRQPGGGRLRAVGPLRLDLAHVVAGGSRRRPRRPRRSSSCGSAIRAWRGRAPRCWKRRRCSPR